MFNNLRHIQNKLVEVLLQMDEQWQPGLDADHRQSIRSGMEVADKRECVARYAGCI